MNIIAVRTAPVIRSIVNDVSCMRLAFSLSPSPRAMDISGAPPMPARLANAVISEISGKAMPTPVSAAVPVPGILAMNTLSTMLYARCTSSARKMGTASLNMVFTTLPCEKSPFALTIVLLFSKPV